ncbi:MAG: histidine kinase [Thiobacillaceae bacterium]
MFRLLRYYSILSLVAIVAAALMLSLFYREVAFNGILRLAERGNQSLARAALNSMRPELARYLNGVANLGPEGIKNYPLPAEVAASINEIMQGEPVVGIKVYTLRGLVLFSTKTNQIGDDQSRDPHFNSAINGKVSSNLVYRDALNTFQGATEDDNLMQTYIPVRASATGPVLGVFRIDTDANRLVHGNDWIEIQIFAGAALILSALYLFLILVVRRARDTIEQQQRTIQERTKTLQTLAARMLNSEEAYKKKIASELHEGLAQTLAAIKLNIESGEQTLKDNNAVARSREDVIPELQKVIQEVRALATELRPSSLDDFGLLPTVTSLCRELEQRHPQIKVNQETNLEEKEIPAALKIIIYRTVTLALSDIEQFTNSSRIVITLMRTANGLGLIVNTTPKGPPPTEAIQPVGDDYHLQPRFARMFELVTLSGGDFNVSRNSAGGIILKASWGHLIKPG